MHIDLFTVPLYFYIFNLGMDDFAQALRLRAVMTKRTSYAKVDYTASGERERRTGGLIVLDKADLTAAPSSQVGLRLSGLWAKSHGVCLVCVINASERLAPWGT